MHISKLAMLLILTQASSAHAWPKPELKYLDAAPPLADLHPADDATDLAGLVAARKQNLSWCNEARGYEKVSPATFFKDLLSPSQLSAVTPLLEDILKHDLSAVVGKLKKQFSRPRPYVSNTLAPVQGHRGFCEDIAAAEGVSAPKGSGCERKLECRHESSEKPDQSFPSMHAASATLWAEILEAAVPGAHGQFLERAARIRLSREVLAVHNPSDVDTGKTIALRMWEALSRQPHESCESESHVKCTPFWRELEKVKKKIP